MLNICINSSQKIMLRVLGVEDKEKETWLIEDMKVHGWSLRNSSNVNGLMVYVFCKPEEPDLNWYVVYSIDGKEERVGPYTSRQAGMDAYFEIARMINVDGNMDEGNRCKLVRVEYLVENCESARFNRIAAALDSPVSVDGITTAEISAGVSVEKTVTMRSREEALRDIAMYAHAVSAASSSEPWTASRLESDLRAMQQALNDWAEDQRRAVLGDSMPQRIRRRREPDGILDLLEGDIGSR